jgi:hypothetical protein
MNTRTIILFFALLNLIVAYLLTGDETVAWLTGYSLGLFAVLIHLFTTLLSKNVSDRHFSNTYFFSLFVRFLIVCVIFTAILIMTKIDEFGFTVSFIISYIFHSVNEVIFLNRKLSN